MKEYKEIEINNGRKIFLSKEEGGMEVLTEDAGRGIESSYIIPDDELIMLLNYYRNCKSGLEKSDYIAKGKIVNTNATGMIEYL